MGRSGTVLLIAALLAGVTACDSPESAGRPPAGAGSPQGSDAGPPTPEQPPVSRRLGEAYRHDDGTVDATIVVDLFREATLPPGDLIAVAVVVDVRAGTLTFGPDLVRFRYDGRDRGTGTVMSGPPASAPLGPGSSTRWVVRFAAPARTTGATVTVHVGATLPAVEWLL